MIAKLRKWVDDIIVMLAKVLDGIAIAAFSIALVFYGIVGNWPCVGAYFCAIGWAVIARNRAELNDIYTKALDIISKQYGKLISEHNALKELCNAKSSLSKKDTANDCKQC